MLCCCGMWSAVVSDVVQAVVVKHVATRCVVLDDSLPTPLCNIDSGPGGSSNYGSYSADTHLVVVDHQLRRTRGLSSTAVLQTKHRAWNRSNHWKKGTAVRLPCEGRSRASA